ncbi:MAG: DUF1326 domain-containing protein [Chloroflexota bacterium]|nr:DUF1326 domain-containing protein [Chloroflexota bacterium]MBI5703356.1 DUF1326 domain-containing protein [Chloroflexota bacterium]
MSKPVKWKLKIEHLMACNCNWGCPCSFNAPPTYGICEAAEAFRIVTGKYGEIVLDGLAWVLAASWPGPLHEGKGRGVVYLDDRAQGPQREALAAIATGKAGGPIGIFMSTITNGLEVYSAKIDVHYNGKHSSFRAADSVRVEFEPIRNPVTGFDHLPSALLPTGLLTKREDFFSARDFSVQTNSLKFSYPGHNAIAFGTLWRGP